MIHHHNTPLRQDIACFILSRPALLQNCMANDREKSHSLRLHTTKKTKDQLKKEWSHLPLHQIEPLTDVIGEHKGGVLHWALQHLTEVFFDFRKGAPQLKFEPLLDWQHLCSHILIEPVYCYAIAANDHALAPYMQNRSRDELQHLFTGGLLPSIDEPMVERLREVGLCEPHRHLNGSMLPLSVILELLRNPAKLIKGNELRGKSVKDKAEIIVVHRLLNSASILRKCLLAKLLADAKQVARPTWTEDWRTVIQDRLAHFDCLPALHMPKVDNFLPIVRDPAASLAGAVTNHPVSIERALLYHAFRRLARHHAECKREQLNVEASHADDEWFAGALHGYIALLNQIHKTLVQPFGEAKGWERFDIDFSQSILRRIAENNIPERITQAHVTGAVHWLELRVAPKNNARDMWKSWREIFEHSGPPQTGLIFHFIKLKDKTKLGLPFSPPRHFALRKNLKRQAAALSRLHEMKPISDKVLGIDAANSELNAFPDVFAPVMRRLRTRPTTLPTYGIAAVPTSLGGCLRRGLGITFHAGEDFRHILSGMRTIDEAVTFLSMGAGDRIGHGLAIGVEPQRWLERSHGDWLLPRGEWLDNLVWFRSQLANHNCHKLATEIEREIHRRSFEVVGRVCNWDLLHRAWKQRYLDPLDNSNEDVLKARDEDPEAVELWQSYHCNTKYRRNHEEFIPVKLERARWNEWTTALRLIQDDMLQTLRQKRIAIEINPSSNVAIGIFDNLTEHPVFRWHPPVRNEQAIRPIIMVGSDDPGIFGTEILYEYAYLARAAEIRGATPREIRDWLEELRVSSIDFSFLLNGIAPVK